MSVEGQDLIWVHGSSVVVEEARFDRHDEPRTLIRFRGPIRREWRDSLSARAVAIEFWCPPFGACITLPDSVAPSQLGDVFPFLAGAAAYREDHCTRGLASHTPDHRAAMGLPGDLVDIVCLSSGVRARVEAELAARGIAIVARSSSKLRVRYAGKLSTLRDLAGVKLADPARGSVVLAASPLGNAQAAQAAQGSLDDHRAVLDGSGEIIAIADTGLDCGEDGPAMHADFRGRIALLASWPINATWSDVVVQPGRDDGAADRNTGHGTHVAGLALGNGASSAGAWCGVAPAARLVFQALEQYCNLRPEASDPPRSGYYLSGRPLDLRELFRQARDHGACIHVNSWGDPASGGYTDDCYETDLFLRENPAALVLFAAGNDGADRDADGRVDPGSLYAPASAKNALAIGATEGPLSGRGLRATWASAFDPRSTRFRHLVDRSQPVSGCPERIAPFSSAGPTVDGRIKPDLCAPGTNLPAPRSRSCNAQGWGLADPLPHYMYDGGTSTATGVAGGASALVRQAWRAVAGQPPSGVALKAILVAGALPVRGRADHVAALPREAGHGRISVARSLPGRVRLFGDDDPGLVTGESREFAIDVPDGATLRAVLAWYDTPGERLINDLDLNLLAPDGSRTLGNQGPTPDRTNTVEVIQRIELNEGRYVLTVVGFNVPDGPQRFALAVAIDPRDDGAR